MISVEDALQRLLQGVSRLGSERVTIDRAADRVLAEDIASGHDMPAFDRSAMDGYAVRASHFEGAGPWVLPIAGESRAGGGAPQLGPGTACRIFTGAPLPHDANAIIVQEAVARSGNTVTIDERPRAGQNIRPRGADLARGSVALRAGSRLSPGRLGLLAALDRAHVAVGRRPVMTVVSTGDELRPPGVSGPESTIAESNSYVVAAIARRVGAIARCAPLVADDPERTELELRRAMRGSDLLVTIGGASVGDHDLVRPALQEIGVTMDFWGVAIKPGKPLAAGRQAGCRVLVLPGNPASATVTFLLFGVPLLKAMQGQLHPRPPRTPLRIIGSHLRRPGREEYLRARLEIRDGEQCAVLPASQSSGAVKSVAEADALVVMAAALEGIDNGDRLPVIRLSDMWSA